MATRHDLASAQEAAAHAQERSLLEQQLRDLRREARMESTLRLLVDIHSRGLRKCLQQWGAVVASQQRLNDCLSGVQTANVGHGLHLLGSHSDGGSSWPTARRSGVSSSVKSPSDFSR